MAHWNRRSCIGNSNSLFHLHFFFSPPRYLNGDLLSNDSCPYLFPPPKTIKIGTCRVRIWSSLYLLKRRFICCPLSNRKNPGLNRLQPVEFSANVVLFLVHDTLHCFHFPCEKK